MIRAELGRLVVATAAPETRKEASASGWTEAAAFLSRLPPGARAFDPDDPARPARSDYSINRMPARAGRRRTSNGSTAMRSAITSTTCFLHRRDLFRFPSSRPSSGHSCSSSGRVIGSCWAGSSAAAGRGSRCPSSRLHSPHSPSWRRSIISARRIRGRLVIIDVGRDGRVLRESRLELLFTARDKETATELRQSLTVPTAFDRAAIGGQRRTIYRFTMVNSPARTILRQRLQQWTPQINRLLTFETIADDSGIRWDAISAKELVGKGDATRMFMERAGAEGFTCMVIHRGQPKDSAARKHSDFRFLSALSILPNESERGSEPAKAPSGDADLSDLALIAHDDPTACLVTAIKRLPGEVRNLPPPLPHR